MLVNYPNGTVKMFRYSNKTVMLLNLWDKTQHNSLKYNMSDLLILQGTIHQTPKKKSSRKNFLYCMAISTTLIDSPTQGFAKLTPCMHTGPVNNIIFWSYLCFNETYVVNHHIKYRTIFWTGHYFTILLYFIIHKILKYIATWCQACGKPFYTMHCTQKGIL